MKRINLILLFIISFSLNAYDVKDDESIGVITLMIDGLKNANFRIDEKIKNNFKNDLPINILDMAVMKFLNTGDPDLTEDSFEKFEKNMKSFKASKATRSIITDIKMHSVRNALSIVEHYATIFFKVKKK